MQGILVDNSGVVDRLRAAWAKTLTFSSSSKMLDARHLTECPRQIVSRALNPNSVAKTSSQIAREAMDSRAKCLWMNVLEHNYNFQIETRDLEVVDSALWLRTIVDAKLKVDGKSVVAIFKHASLNDMEKLKTMGPMKRDVVTVASAAWMTELHDGIIVYSHGDEATFHHVTVGSKLMDPISQKCRELCEYLLVSKLPPPCKSKHCGFCG